MQHPVTTFLIGLAVAAISITFPERAMAQGEALRFMRHDGGIANGLDQADYIRRVEAPDSRDGWPVLKEFYRNFQLKRQGYLMEGSTIEQPKFHGRVITYYKNGNTESEITYDKGERTGPANFYYPNGQLQKTMVHASPPLKRRKANATGPAPDTLLAYFDSLGSKLVSGGNGYIREPIKIRPETADNTQNDAPEGLTTDGYEEGTYREGLREGRWRGTFMNGKYTFDETYNAGMLLSGVSRDSIGNEYPYTDAESHTTREHNTHAIRNHISKNFRYPRAAMSAGVQGYLLLEFALDEDGRISDIKLLQDMGYGTADAAISALKALRRGRLNPTYRRGVPDREKYTLPIRLHVVR